MATDGYDQPAPPTTGPCFDPRAYIRSQRWVSADPDRTNSHEYVTPSGSTDLDEHVHFLHWISESDTVEVIHDCVRPVRLVDQQRYWASRQPYVSFLPGVPFFAVLNRRLALECGGRPASMAETEVRRAHSDRASGRRRILWGRTAGGITGVHEWMFTPTNDGVHVMTNESFAGEPVEADPAGMQSMLDASLVAWLGSLKSAAESNAGV